MSGQGAAVQCIWVAPCLCRVFVTGPCFVCIWEHICPCVSLACPWAHMQAIRVTSHLSQSQESPSFMPSHPSGPSGSGIDGVQSRGCGKTIWELNRSLGLPTHRSRGQQGCTA